MTAQCRLLLLHEWTVRVTAEAACYCLPPSTSSTMDSTLHLHPRGTMTGWTSVMDVRSDFLHLQIALHPGPTGALRDIAENSCKVREWI